MKIGIFGKNSFIGRSIAKLLELKGDFVIEYIDSRTDAWKSSSFSDLDVLICVAGIAHVSLDPEMESKYYAVNRDLPIAVAQKAKSDGVRHFIFFSSIIVYGDDVSPGQKMIIDGKTVPNPANFYGKSKLQAEQGILPLQAANFTVSCVRVPMVYGPGCKGNFISLVNLARRFPFFPDIANERSMIYIDNLTEYVYQCIVNTWPGVLFPQNRSYVSTMSIIETTALFYGKRVRFIKIFNPLIILLSKKVSMLNKLFGTRVYDFSLSGETEDYNTYDFEESIKHTLQELEREPL